MMIVSCISGGKGWKSGARWGASGLSEERVAVLQQRVALREELRGVRRHLHVALRGAGYDRVHVGAKGRELLREPAEAVSGGCSASTGSRDRALVVWFVKSAAESARRRARSNSSLLRLAARSAVEIPAAGSAGPPARPAGDDVDALLQGNDSALAALRAR